MTKKKGKAIPVDVYDKDGNMVRIEFSDGSGNHIVDALWDDQDEQTSDNRIAFREWAYRLVRQQGWEIAK